MYRIVWEYDIHPQTATEFEDVYGEAGTWAKFFGRSDDYVRTELFRNVGVDTTRYVTLDSWRNRAAYESFRKAYAEEYAALDQWCQRLIKHERTLGVTDDGKG